MIRRLWARLRAMLKYKTTKLNSLNEPRTDTVLEVQNGFHNVDITVGFIEQPKEENHG